MKTTITLPDAYHKELKKLAIERSTTMAELVWEAVKQTFFSRVKKEEKSKPDLPFNRLEGIMASHSTSEEEIEALKIHHASSLTNSPCRYPRKFNNTIT